METSTAQATAQINGTVDLLKQAGFEAVTYTPMYGDAVEEPMTEEHPFHNRTMYGATKIAGEQFFRAYHEQHGLDYVGLRYMNVYGPRMDYKGTYVSVDPFHVFRYLDEQVFRFDLRMIGFLGELLRRDDGFLGFLRVLTDVHIVV